ncbi:MAG: 4'-phosphopantetheinyl transferase superfamily protein [Bacteroidales bacterium]|nr:4'-phosphopantetheinyl transferase superfamily protein [Bacteroidales bacterium]
MGVFLNRTFSDGSVVAVWRITESSGKSLNEQRLAVSALIHSVFEGKFRLCHDNEGVPILETAKKCDLGDGGSVSGFSPAPFVSVSHTRGWVAAMTSPKEHVGIDIELSDRDFSAVGKKALSDSELSRLDSWAEVLKNSLPTDTDDTSSETAPTTNPRNAVLGLIWCAKEAVYKRLTVPATDFANQIGIESIIPTSTDKGKITAIFFEGSETTEICLEYYIISGLLLVYTK